jgi:hypothetical protein
VKILPFFLRRFFLKNTDTQHCHKNGFRNRASLPYRALEQTFENIRAKLIVIHKIFTQKEDEIAPKARFPVGKNKLIFFTTANSESRVNPRR